MRGVIFWGAVYGHRRVQEKGRLCFGVIAVSAERSDGLALVAEAHHRYAIGRRRRQPAGPEDFSPWPDQG